MTTPKSSAAPASRRDFLKTTGTLTAASVLAGVTLPHVHAAENNTMQVALIGCGGRGTGATANALGTSKLGPIKLVAMADVFEDKLKTSYSAIKRQFDSQTDVPEDRKFIGYDAFQKAMDCLKPTDIAIFATPVAFRWVHYAYAIKKGLNVFMEKPVTVDGPTTRRMIQLAEEGDRKGLKAGVGLMVRHCRGRRELFDRIQGGEIGEITNMRAYRMHGPAGSCFAQPKPAGQNELLYQIRNFHSFLWASGGLFSDFYIHQIDECSWMKNSWPVKAHALGGRHYRGTSVDQNFDTYSVEYTYADGSTFFMNGRTMVGAYDNFSSYVHGTKGMGIVSMTSHTPGKVRTFKGQSMTNENLIWKFPQPEPNPYDLEWEDLVTAIRNNLPYNEVKRGAEASLVTSMGRKSAHTGQIVTFEDMMNSTQEYAPDVDKLTKDSPAPLLANADGKYPIPEPGVKNDREY